MYCIIPGFPVLQCLLEFAQTHVHWVDDAILPSLTSVDPFFYPQSFSASRSFPMSQLFTSGLSIRASASASVLPMNIHGWFPLGWTDLISLLSRGLSGVFFSTTIQKRLLWHSAFFMFQLSHPYMTTGKTIALTRWTFVSQVMSLLFKMLSRFVIVFFFF